MWPVVFTISNAVDTVLCLQYSVCLLKRGLVKEKGDLGFLMDPFTCVAVTCSFAHHDNELAQAAAYFHNQEVWVPLTHHL